MIGPTPRLLHDNTQDSQETDIHAPGRIRTQNPSNGHRLRFRPRRHRHRPSINIKVKVKWSRYRPGVAQRVGRGLALLFHDRDTRREWVVSSTPRPHFTPGKDPLPIVQEAGWAQGRSGRAEYLVPIGIRSRTVQPVVSRYTDWATRPTKFWNTDTIIIIIIIIIIILDTLSS